MTNKKLTYDELYDYVMEKQEDLDDKDFVSLFVDTFGYDFMGEYFIEYVQNTDEEGLEDIKNSIDNLIKEKEGK